jgi:hypothetical protein
MKTALRIDKPSRCLFCLGVVLAALLPQISLSAPQTNTRATVTAKPYQPTQNPMKNFVILFRQGPRTLTDAEKQRRTEEVSVWARQQNEAGHKLDPHILAPDSEWRGLEKGTAPRAEAWTVTALLFLEARDLNEATRVAEEHPALHYGASVEVRPWATPVPVAPPAAR